uniref:Uncharacterized protein n=1 Tax=Clandestinovirus TaxID=2831644 RepID=A0A8F8KKI5_9VIRU|nr:hypothetical protein KOM_12_43 [Clandestinovirus]
MGHGYFTVFGYGFIVDRKSFIRQVNCDDECDGVHVDWKELKYWEALLTKEHGVQIHLESENAEDKDAKYGFLCFTDCQYWQDARGACGRVQKVKLDEAMKKITPERVEKMRAFLQNEGIVFFEPGLYMYSYED